MTKNNEPTPGQARMAQAHAARRRQGETRLAQKLDERGWLCFPPECADQVRDIISRQSSGTDNYEGE